MIVVGTNSKFTSTHNLNVCHHMSKTTCKPVIFVPYFGNLSLSELTTQQHSKDDASFVIWNLSPLQVLQMMSN